VIETFSSGQLNPYLRTRAQAAPPPRLSDPHETSQSCIIHAAYETAEHSRPAFASVSATACAKPTQHLELRRRRHGKMRAHVARRHGVLHHQGEQKHGPIVEVDTEERLHLTSEQFISRAFASQRSSASILVSHTLR